MLEVNIPSCNLDIVPGTWRKTEFRWNKCVPKQSLRHLNKPIVLHLYGRLSRCTLHGTRLSANNNLTSKGGPPTGRLPRESGKRNLKVRLCCIAFVLFGAYSVKLQRRPRYTVRIYLVPNGRCKLPSVEEGYTRVRSPFRFRSSIYEARHHGLLLFFPSTFLGSLQSGFVESPRNRAGTFSSLFSSFCLVVPMNVPLLAHRL